MYNYFKFLLIQNSWIALLFRKKILLAILLSITTENSFKEKQN